METGLFCDVHRTLFGAYGVLLLCTWGSFVLCMGLLWCIWREGSFFIFIGLFCDAYGALLFCIWGSCGVYGERALLLFT